MAINMQALLQAISGPGYQTPPINGDPRHAPPGTPLPPVEGEDITVTGQTPRAPVVADPNLNVPLEPLQAKPEQIQAMQPLKGLPQHKGLFGMKGTLRDVIGILGDSLLVGSGRDAIYAPHKQKERVSDAMVGFTGNPKDQLAAIQRVAAQDPALAQKLWDQYNDQQNKIDDREVKSKWYESQTNTKRAAQRIQKAKYVTGLMAAAEGNPDQQAAIKAWYEDPDSSIEDLDPETLASAAMNPYQKATVDYRDRNLGERTRHNRATEGIGQQNAQSNRIRANKAPSAKPRSQSELEYFQQIDAIPENKRTKGQRAFYTKYTEGTKGNRRPPPGRAAAPTKSTSSGGGWGKMTVK